MEQVTNDGNLIFKQEDRVNLVHTAIFEMLKTVLSKTNKPYVESITDICAIADVLEELAVKRGWTEMEFYPFVETVDQQDDPFSNEIDSFNQAYPGIHKSEVS